MARTPELEEFYKGIIKKGVQTYAEDGEDIFYVWAMYNEPDALLLIRDKYARGEQPVELDLTVGVIVKAFSRIRRGDVQGLSNLYRQMYLVAFANHDLRMLSGRDCRRIFQIGLWQEVL